MPKKWMKGVSPEKTRRSGTKLVMNKETESTVAKNHVPTQKQ